MALDDALVQYASRCTAATRIADVRMALEFFSHWVDKPFGAMRFTYKLERDYLPVEDGELPFGIDFGGGD